MTNVNGTFRSLWLTVLVLCLALFTQGCGGGGGGGSSVKPGELTGIWNGSITRSTDTLKLSWTLSGSDLTGVAVLTRDGQTYIGSLSGTVDTNALTFNVNATYDGLTGAFNYSGTYSTSVINANITRDGAPEGTMSLSRIGDNQAVSFSGDYSGTWKRITSPAASGGLTVTASQNGSEIEGTWLATFEGSESGGGSFHAVLIGDQLTAGFADSGGGPDISFTGKVSGGKVTGSTSWYEEENGQLHKATGSFSLNHD